MKRFNDPPKVVSTGKLTDVEIKSRSFTASTHLSLCHSLTRDENQLKTAFWQREKRNPNEKMS